MFYRGALNHPTIIFSRLASEKSGLRVVQVETANSQRMMDEVEKRNEPTFPHDTLLSKSSKSTINSALVFYQSRDFWKMNRNISTFLLCHIKQRSEFFNAEK